MPDVRYTGYSPLAHLPAGRILDRDTHNALMAAWQATGYDVMSASAIEAIVGPPLTPPSIKRLPGEGFF